MARIIKPIVAAGARSIHPTESRPKASSPSTKTNEPTYSTYRRIPFSRLLINNQFQGYFTYTPIIETPGETTVKLNNKVGKGRQTLKVKYPPASIPEVQSAFSTDKALPREEIKLPGITSEYIAEAKTLTEEIKQVWIRSGLNTTKPSSGQFLTIANQAYKNLHPGASECDDQVLLSLAAFYSTRNDFSNPEGFLSRSPSGFFNLDDPNIDAKLETMCKLCIVNIWEIDNVADLEKMSPWQEKWRKTGMTSLRYVELPELLKITFPGYLDGENPPIREWLLSSTYKWSGGLNDEESLIERRVLASKAARWFIKYGIPGAVDGNDVICNETLARKNVYALSIKPEHGIAGMVASYSDVQSSHDLVNLGIPGILGIKEGQLPPWKVSALGMWDTWSTYDQLTEWALIDLCPKGKINAKNVRAVSSKLRNRILQESEYALREATAFDLFSHRFPELVGLKESQVGEWDFNHEGRREGERGVKLSRLELAVKLERAGLGKISHNKDKLTFTFDKEEFSDWYNSPNINRNFYSFLARSNMKGLYDHAGSNSKQVLELLLDTEIADIPGARKLRNDTSEGPTVEELIDSVSYPNKEEQFTIDLEVPFKPLGLTAADVVGWLKEPMPYPLQDEYLHSCDVQSANNTNLLNNIDYLPAIYQLTDAFVHGSSKSSECTNLERMMNASVEGEYVISDDEITTVLKGIRNYPETLDSINLNEEAKNEVLLFIDALINSEKSPRETLLKGANNSDKYTYYWLFDYTFSNIVGSAAIKAATYRKVSGYDSVIHEGYPLPESYDRDKVENGAVKIRSELKNKLKKDNSISETDFIENVRAASQKARVKATPSNEALLALEYLEDGCLFKDIPECYITPMAECFDERVKALWYYAVAA